MNGFKYDSHSTAPDLLDDLVFAQNFRNGVVNGQFPGRLRLVNIVQHHQRRENRVDPIGKMRILLFVFFDRRMFAILKSRCKRISDVVDRDFKFRFTHS